MVVDVYLKRRRFCGRSGLASCAGDLPAGGGHHWYGGCVVAPRVIAIPVAVVIFRRQLQPTTPVVLATRRRQVPNLKCDQRSSPSPAGISLRSRWPSSKATTEIGSRIRG